MKKTIQVVVGYNNKIIEIAAMEKPFQKDFLDSICYYDNMRVVEVEVDVPEFKDITPRPKD